VQSSNYYKDAAIFRFTDEEGTVKVASESEFITIYTKRNGDPFWRSIECVQTCIKTKLGLGKHVHVEFAAKVPIGSIGELDLVFNFKRFGAKIQ